MATEVLWWLFAAVMVASAIGVVAARSIIHSAIFLIISLGVVGAMYLFLTVEFLALVQFLIYGGAVTVLILLALMLTRMATGDERMIVNGPQAPFGFLVAGVLAVILVGVAFGTSWPGDVDDLPANISIHQVSEVMFMNFGAPFIFVAVLLLVALVGAIILARQEDAE
ncbi:MAG: NADH-quinone oxidoreductase subunit J [Dehalococcoidia bacterium]|nr:NADH-quinone oxidoreductase subunit J [Dehalococcoidia bacterium]